MGAILRSVSLVTIAVLVCSCAAAPQKLSDEDRKKFSAVKINDTVQKPAEVFLYLPGTSFGNVFGVAGALVDIGVASSKDDPKQAFVALLQKNGISIEKIVREEVERALQESGKVAIANVGDSSVPVINITVQRYGF